MLCTFLLLLAYHQSIYVYVRYNIFNVWIAFDKYKIAYVDKFKPNLLDDFLAMSRTDGIQGVVSVKCIPGIRADEYIEIYKKRGAYIFSKNYKTKVGASIAVITHNEGDGFIEIHFIHEKEDTYISYMGSEHNFKFFESMIDSIELNSST